MDLRLVNRAALPCPRNNLPTAHLVATLHKNFTVMGVGGHEIILVPDQDEIAVSGELVAGIGNHAIFCGFH